MKPVFHTNDPIVPTLKFPDPCPISIQIKEKDIILHVGQRDWQWDLEDGHLVGQGTRFDPHVKDSEGMTKVDRRSLGVRQKRVRQSMLRARRKREKNGTSPPGDDRLPIGFQIEKT